MISILFKFCKFLFKFSLVCLSFVIILTTIAQAIVFFRAKKHILPLEQIPYSDAILVFGAFVKPSGPSDMLIDRLENARVLYENNKAPKIIVSGGIAHDLLNEAVIMKDWLVEKGVPDEDIVVDTGGKNSFLSIYNAKFTFGVSSVILATQSFHMHRCIYLAKTMGLSVSGYASPNKKSFNMVYNNSREYLARVKAVIDSFLYKNDTMLEIPGF